MKAIQEVVDIWHNDHGVVDDDIMKMMATVLININGVKQVIDTYGT